MINAIIIDDEPVARAALSHEIDLYFPNIRVIAETGSVAETLEVLSRQPLARLLFVDIQLGDGSGFDILSNIDLDRYKVIFTSAHSEYALPAIKFSPLDYLLKPIDTDELKIAIEKAVKRQQNDLSEQMWEFMQQIHAGVSPARIALATADGLHLYYVKDIIRCASDDNYATVYFTNGSKLLVAKTLKDLELLLLPYRFERIHKSHLINVEHLRHYYNRFTSKVEMSDGAVLPVALRKRSYLLELMNGLKG